MRNKKFNLTDYQPFRSSQLRETTHQFASGFKSRHSPHKSAFFKREIISKTKQFDIERILTKRQGIFSLQKIQLQKRKLQKQLIESARLPNFSIKRFFQKSANKKSNEQLQNMSNSCSSTKRQTTAQPALKRYWERYLNQEISYADLTRELNKNIVDLSQRDKRNLSEKRYFDSSNQQNQNKIEKSAFYINNFIKTTYRKRRFQHKIHIEEELPLKQPIKIQVTLKKPCKEAQINQKNWSMIPWQKDINGTQYQEQFNPL